MRKLRTHHLARRALVALVLVACTTGVSRAPSVAQTPEAAGAVVVAVEPSAFDAAASTWTSYGPLYEGNPYVVNYGAGYLHAYGAFQGRLVYRVVLETMPATDTIVTARLSSEYPGYQAPPEWVSDVKLVVNGVAYGTRRVIADDGSGQRYRWHVSASAWRAGRNSIAFVVPLDSRFQHGLCIYDQALLPGEDDARIVVRLAG